MELRMKQVRKLNKLTLKEVADLVRVSESAVSQYEHGKSLPSESVIHLFCEKLHISESWLRTGEGEMEVPAASDLVDQLAREHNLGPGHVALLRAVARAFEELDEDAFNCVMDQLLADLQAAVAARHTFDPAAREVPDPHASADAASSAASAGSVVS